MLAHTIAHNAGRLAVFALITAGLIALTYQTTRARIVESELRAQQRALFEIVPPTEHNNDMLTDTVELEPELARALGMEAGAKLYVARRDGEVSAMIFPAVAPDGYSGDINMIVGISRDGVVEGVRVLSHQETPGLGDKVDLGKSPWILSFEDKSLNDPEAESWKVKKDGGAFDQFTGATITPRAVVSQVKDVLQFYAAHRAELLARAQIGGEHE